MRELIVDDKGNIVRPPDDEKKPRRPSAGAAAQAAELKPGQTRKELEGVFVVQNNKAVFMPVKTGIAGEKYFEVLSGLKEGDAVITGPFASVRSLAEGAAVKTTTGDDDAGRAQAVNQFFEAAMIALGAIWANKLRSFLTVLGNIVAVTSIIAVVSLVQGMNGYVTTPSSRASAPTTSRFSGCRSCDRKPTRNASATTRGSRCEEAAAVRKYSENIGAVAAQAQSRATMTYGSETLDGAQVQGVSRDYVYFGDVQRGTAAG